MKKIIIIGGLSLFSTVSLSQVSNSRSIQTAPEETKKQTEIQTDTAAVRSMISNKRITNNPRKTLPRTPAASIKEENTMGNEKSVGTARMKRSEN